MLRLLHSAQSYTKVEEEITMQATPKLRQVLHSMIFKIENEHDSGNSHAVTTQTVKIPVRYCTTREMQALTKLLSTFLNTRSKFSQLLENKYTPIFLLHENIISKRPSLLSTHGYFPLIFTLFHSSNNILLQQAETSTSCRFCCKSVSSSSLG